MLAMGRKIVTLLQFVSWRVVIGMGTFEQIVLGRFHADELHTKSDTFQRKTRRERVEKKK